MWGKRVRVAKRGETSPCKGPGAEAKGKRELVGNEIREALRHQTFQGLPGYGKDWGEGVISEMGRYMKG